MVHGGPRAVRDRFGVDPILDDGAAVGAGRFFESGVAVFFCNVLGLMYYMVPNEILVFKIQASHHLGGRVKPKCAAMDASAFRWRWRRRSARHSVGDQVARYTLW